MFNLLPYLSAVDNVLLPLGFAPERRRRAGPGDGEARRLLGRLGVAEVADEPAARLSVGQQQRVAAARAMIGAPPIVVADEPTSALDTDTQDAFLALLFAELARTGASLLMVSHDRGLRHRFDRVVPLAEIARTGPAGMMLWRLAWRSLANRRADGAADRAGGGGKRRAAARASRRSAPARATASPTRSAAPT